MGQIYLIQAWEDDVGSRRHQHGAIIEEGFARYIQVGAANSRCLMISRLTKIDCNVNQKYSGEKVGIVIVFALLRR